MIAFRKLDNSFLQRLAADPVAALPGSPNCAELVDVVKDVATATLALYAKTGAVSPWFSYLCYSEIDDSLYGTCAFTSAPVDGVVEIAYFTFPGHEGRGIATAMARQLMDIAFATPDVVTLIAHTLPEENASATILRRCGFTQDGFAEDPDAGTVWRWSLRRP